MNTIDTRERPRGGRLHMPRSRGAASGLLLIVLGLWGALAPFIGPQIGFAYSDDAGWTAARGWLEVLPGAVTVIGGVLLLTSRNRITAVLGGWLAVLAGAWFVVGRAVAGPFGLGSVGSPASASDTQRLWLELSYFHGLGALIVFLGGLALGRVSVRAARDVEYARRTVDDRTVIEDTTPLGSHTAASNDDQLTHDRLTHDRVNDHRATDDRATDDRLTDDRLTDPTRTEPTRRGRRFPNPFRSSHADSAR